MTFTNVLLIVQIIICVALVGVILLQRSEGGALGMGGGGSGGFMTARGAGNFLTRTTAILATLFFVVSFGLTVMGNIDRRTGSVTDRVNINAAPGAATPPAGAPAPTDQAPAPAAPAAPAGPSLDDLGAPRPDAGTEPVPATN